VGACMRRHSPCVDKDLDKLPIGHHELWHEVNVVVSVGPQGSRERLSRLILFPELSELHRCRFTSVVAVSIDVKHLQMERS
jgi:hypothetical protein